MKIADLYLASFPLAGRGGSKLRPVLLLTGPVGEVPEFLTGYISSVIPQKLLPSDLIIDPTSAEFASCNLRVISVLRLHKLATVHERDLKRYLGSLSATAMTEVESRLRTLLNL
jgi:mRNA-degrading endonuclease toxin of MazEF toxin-antitoxin module